MKDMNKFRFLEDSDLLIKGITQKMENERKEERGGFPRIPLGILGTNVLGNMLAAKEVIRAFKNF